MELYFSLANTDRTKYEVLEDEKIKYTCVYDEKKFSKSLYNERGELLATGSFNITNRATPLRLHPFTIKLHKENANIGIHFKMLMLTHYYFEYNKDIYKGVFHLGTKISIFKNENQIGYYKTSRMKLIINKDENLSLMLLFCLHMYSDFRGEDADGGNPTFNIVFPLKRFDRNWKPN
jgi:hypothetical protein